MALTKTQVSELYVAIFNRASEGSGNSYWQGQGSAAEVAQEMLDTPDAKEYFGTALDDNKAFIEHIYINALGKTYAQDPVGIDFWVARLASGETRGEVVAALVAAAKDPQYAGTPAQQQFLNRVEVSDYAADNIQNVPENYKQTLGFNGDLVVTENSGTISLAKKAVQELAVETEGETFTLTKGLEDLAAANTAVSDFLEVWGEAQNPVVPNADGDDVETALLTAAEAVDAFIETYTGGPSAYTSGSTGTYNQVASDDASVAVQAALVSDTRTALAKDITDAEKGVADAEAAVAKVAGLQSAYDSDKAADEARVAANKAADKAEVARDAAEKDVKVDAVITITRATAGSPAVTTVTDSTNNADLYTIDATGKVTLGTGITEEDYPGITALIDAEKALIAAEKAEADAQKLADQTQILLNDADLSTAAKTALAEVQTEMDVDAAPTRVEMESKLATLKALAQTAVGNDPQASVLIFTEELDVDGSVDTDDLGVVSTRGASFIDAGSAAQATKDAVAAYNELAALVDDYITKADASNPLTTALATKETGLKTAQDKSAAFEKLVAAQEAAQADEDALTALEKTATDAAKALVDAGYVVVEVDGNKVGTAEDDVFLPTTTDANISLFGLLGEDKLFLGDAVYNSTEIGTGAGQTLLSKAGDNSVVEFFLVQNGADVDVVIEDNAFGSSAATAEITTIKLVGLTVEELAVADGFITLA